jgi:apolipoprotein N-acyltransferase
MPASAPSRDDGARVEDPVPSRPSRSSWLTGLGAGALGGVLVALSLPPFGWWPLAWIGMAVVAIALVDRPWRGRLAVGAGFGLADYVIGLLWVQEFSVPGYIAVVIVSALYAVAVAVMVPGGRRRWIAIGLPCAFVLADWARDRFPLGGLPLAGVALGQASGPLVPVARLGGSLGLVGETVLVGVALAELVRLGWAAWVRRRQTAPSGRTAPATARTGPAGLAGLGRPARLALLPAVLAVAVPLVALASPTGAGGHLAPIRVGLVQGGGPRGTRAVNTDPQVVFQRHLDESARLTGPLDLVVWPEGVLQSHRPFTQSADAAEVARIAQQHGATALVGVDQDVGTTQYLNEVVAWNSRGEVVGRYVKNHLVPFGEYVPYRSLIEKLFNVADVPYDGIPGHSPGFLRTPAGPLGVMISYEVFFDERARGGVRAGGQILVVPTNTASYRSTQVPTQEVAADRIRTWETGRWLVQVTPTGYSTVVSPTGQILHRSRLGQAAVVEATVPLRTGLTVYDHIGDATVVSVAAVGWAAVAAWAGWPVLAARRRGRRRGVADNTVQLDPVETAT